eukprot:5906668-Ditylum_brightwellii.AAC.1
MHGIDIDNMSRDTENEYVIMKYHCKELQELCDDTPENRNLRRPSHDQHGINSFYTRPYAKIGGKSK